MKEKLIAIDIVVVPPENIIKKAIEINKNLSGVIARQYPRLGKHCVPHLSLAMAFVYKKDILKIKKILAKVADAQNPIQITITSSFSNPRPDGLTGVGWKIRHTDILQSLHEHMMTELELYMHKGGATAYYNSDKEEIAKRSIDWMNNYKTDHAFEKFQCHISLGIGEPIETNPMKFTATTLAIFHLGNRNTCRKLLAKFLLRPVS